MRSLCCTTRRVHLRRWRRCRSAVTPNIFIQECFDDFLEPWTEDVLYGCLRVELDEEEEAMKHPYSPKHFLRMFRPGWERRDVALRE
jgi:hypothetical protein